LFGAYKNHNTNSPISLFGFSDKNESNNPKGILYGENKASGDQNNNRTKTQTNSLFNTQNDNKQKEKSIAINVIISSKKYSTLVLIQVHQIHYSMFQIIMIKQKI
jgi:hypothetical protein